MTPFQGFQEWWCRGPGAVPRAVSSCPFGADGKPHLERDLELPAVHAAPGSGHLSGMPAPCPVRMVRAPEAAAIPPGSVLPLRGDEAGTGVPGVPGRPGEAGTGVPGIPGRTGEARTGVPAIPARPAEAGTSVPLMFGRAGEAGTGVPLMFGRPGEVGTSVPLMF